MVANVEAKALKNCCSAQDKDADNVLEQHLICQSWAAAGFLVLSSRPLFKPVSDPGGPGPVHLAHSVQKNISSGQQCQTKSFCDTNSELEKCCHHGKIVFMTLEEGCLRYMRNPTPLSHQLGNFISFTHFHKK